jgi:diguanylate cyclase (GGDEF)-like protein
MSIKSKLILIILLFFSIVVIGGTYYAYITQLKLSINTTKKDAKISGIIILSSLNSMMLNGTILKSSDRKILFSIIRKVNGIKKFKLVRGAPINKEFGKGLAQEKATSKFDRKILDSKKIIFKQFFKKNHPYLKIGVPFIAKTSERGIDCLECHDVPSGTIVGGVNLTYSLKNVYNSSKKFLITIAILAVIVFTIIAFILIKFSSVYIKLFKTLEEKFAYMQEGNFDKANIITAKLPNDEAGEVAKSFNNTVKTFSDALLDISNKISILIGYNIMKTDNNLKDTSKIINELVSIHNFKKTIEHDMTKQEIYERINNILYDYMSIMTYAIYEIDNNKMKIVSTKGLEKYMKYFEGESWCFNVEKEDAGSCRAVRIGEDIDSKEFYHICNRFKLYDKGLNFYCIPVYLGGKVGFIVQIIYEKDMDDFIYTILNYIKGYLSESSTVIESKVLTEKLKEQAIVDTLTGLYNRRFIEDGIENILAGVKRRNSNLGIIMADIDHFKEVNDTYGHDVGDAVLKNVADTIRKNVRQSDYVVRFGGEEFLILLIDTLPDKAYEKAEEIRKAVEELKIKASNINLKKTISLGISELPIDSEKFWQCVKYSDVALYNAKENGRNKVVRFEQSMWQDTEY